MYAWSNIAVIVRGALSTLVKVCNPAVFLCLTAPLSTIGPLGLIITIYCAFCYSIEIHDIIY